MRVLMEEEQERKKKEKMEDEWQIRRTKHSDGFLEVIVAKLSLGIKRHNY